MAQWESTRLPPMWPGFKSQTWHHMWVEFAVGCHVFLQVFLPGFLPSSKTNISKFQFDVETVDRGFLPPSWISMHHVTKKQLQMGSHDLWARDRKSVFHVQEAHRYLPKSSVAIVTQDKNEHELCKSGHQGRIHNLFTSYSYMMAVIVQCQPLN